MVRRPTRASPRAWTAWLCSWQARSSIREIIPFPMNKNAQDIMMGAPSTVEQKQLDELHIALVGQLEEE